MVKNKKRVNWKVDASGFLILCILIALSMLSYSNTKKLIFNAKSVDETYTFMQEIQGLSAALRDTEMDNNVYVLLGKERYLINYREDLKDIKRHFDKVKESLVKYDFKGDPAVLEDLIKQKITDMDLAASERESKDFNSSLQIFLTGKWQKIDDSIQAAINNITDRQKKLLDSQIAEETASIGKTLQSIVWAVLFTLLFFVVAAVIIRRDMKIRLKNEALLEEARTEALQASEFKSQFLANMSHEIRTPMNGIMGMATVLLETPLNPDQAKFTGIIKRSCEALLRIVNDILDFSKVEAGQVAILVEPFDFKSLLLEIEALFSNIIKQKNITLEFKTDSRIPLSLEGDGGRLRQILNNLIGNAIKFTSKGAVTVSAEIVDEVGSQCTLHVAVTDSGIGISEENQKKIFGAFQQAEPTTSKVYGGTGLGLNISKKLIEAMGGTIGFTSALGKGSTFFFELKLAVAAGQVPAPLLVTPATPLIEDKVLTALVAEDDHANREVISKYLEKLNVKATLFENGEDAIKGYSSEFDLIFLDFQMPGMNGIEVLRKIRQAEKDLGKPTRPAFLVTAHITQENKDALTQLQAGVINKPLLFEDFKRKIFNTMNTKMISVLIADDSDVNQDLLRMFLSKEGFDMDFAPNGSVALECFKKKTYDIVLMDVQMPVMNGLEAVREMRAFEKNNKVLTPAPILAFTGGVTDKEIKEALDIGCNGYIAKPIEKNKCIALIKEHLVKRQELQNAS